MVTQMTGKFSVDDTAYIVVSNRMIREVKILKYAGGLYTIRFTDGGGGIKVRESRLFATKEEAEASRRKPTQQAEQAQAPKVKRCTPWD
jgi:hypothetical protein